MSTQGERRRAWAVAVLGRQAERPSTVADERAPITVISGVLLDASPHLMIVETETGEQERLLIAPWATAWRGGDIALTDLPAESYVIVKTMQGGKVVERVWADITRMTGTILAVSGRTDLTVELDRGPHRGRLSVRVPYRSSGRIRVRHPQLEAGYLFDAIGVLEGSTPIARLPATSQPTHRAGQVPPPPPVYGGTQSKISGTAVWSDGTGAGAAYPMLERSDTGCDKTGVSCAGLPYLAIGSLLHVRNVCAGRAGLLPITACGCLAGQFCDRCVDCGTSPRGRVVELPAVSFVELGGDLTDGCFNARVGLG